MKLPDPRKMFIPDPGYIIIDADMSNAEARVGAFECGGNYKEMVKKDAPIHLDTMEKFYPEAYKIKPKHEPEYTKCKNLFYGTIYGGGAPGIAAAAAIPIELVKAFQNYLLYNENARFPEIKQWHRRVEEELFQTSSATNVWGYSIRYFDRTAGLLPTAINWRCQSAIGIACQKSMLLLDRTFPFVEQLLQNHDSTVFQIPYKYKQSLPEIKACLEQVTLPYDEPLTIPWGIKASTSSWGNCQSCNLTSSNISIPI